VASLLIGPLLRYAGPTEATVWVETDAACEVEVLGHRARTFEVAGHHYALVIVEGLAPGSANEYDVRLDGARVWPAGDDPRGCVRTPTRDDELRLAFASCRTANPHEPPWTLSKTDDPRGRGVDALSALARRMRDTPREQWPDALLLVGDQVYADEVSPAVEERIRARRRAEGMEAPIEVADFEEYTWLYQEAWGDEAIRWLMASVPSAMIFDDHDVRDDWNTSGRWIERMRATRWWHQRLIGAYVSYWIYQHLGNMAPGELREDELFAALRAHDGDAEPLMRAFAERAAHEVAGTRWSFRRDYGRTRLVVLDSRAGRIVEDDARRQMLSDEQWDWVSEQLTGDVDHLLVATSLPFLLSSSLHYAQAWNEAVCAGAWGRLGAIAGEKLRQALDLEHWPAFRHCFARLADELRAVGSGERGAPPASIVILSGDVHHAYVAQAAYPRAAGVRSAVVQAVCSPLRNPLDKRERRALRAAQRPQAAFVAALIARAAGVRRPPLRWRFVEEPTFDNQVATIETRGRTAVVRIEKTVPEDWQAPRLHLGLEHAITPPLA
jgi:phosphodiesterase/alkaline phosphatase D-like protein